MKNNIISLFTAVAIAAVIPSVNSCTKPEVSVTPSEKTAKEETLLRYAAKHYELTHYKSTRTAWVFFFDTDESTYAEISVPASLVRGIEDSESYCKVQFTSGNSASLKYVSEVALTLAPVTAVKGYPGESSKVDFEVKKEGRGNVTVSSSDAVVSFDSSTGKGYATVLVPENEGETTEYSITISDGHNNSKYEIHASAYFFTIETTSVTIGADAGDKTELSLRITTDLEDYSYTVVAGKDAFFSVDGDTITAKEDNPGNTERSAELIVRESSGKFTDKSVTVIQKAGVDYSLTSTKIPGAEIWNYGRGEEYSFTLTLTTNLPEERISVTVPEWINAALTEGKLTLTLEANTSGKTRSSLVEVKDSKGKAEGFSFTVNQVSSIVTPEGMVIFDDPYFKAAVLEGFDLNSDNQISEEEALAVKELNVESRHVTSLTGTEAMHNIRSINISDNNINYADFSAFPNFCNLRTINCDRINKPTTIEVSGCFRGPSFTVTGPAKVVREKFGQDNYVGKLSHSALIKLQQHTKGDGIILMFTPFDFVDKEYESGAVMDWIDNYIEGLFSVEPFKSFRDYFDIYISEKTNARRTKTYNDYIESEEGYAFEQETISSEKYELIHVKFGLNEKERSHADGGGTIPKLKYIEKPIEERRFGRSYIFLNNWVPTVIAHEMGHAIGALMDQYETQLQFACESNYTKKSTIEESPWSEFAKLPQYKDRVGMYPKNGGYYPSKTSIMDNHKISHYFDSPSRWSLYYNLLYKSKTQMTQQECWEAFLEYDRINDSLPY